MRRTTTKNVATLLFYRTSVAQLKATSGFEPLSGAQALSEEDLSDALNLLKELIHRLRDLGTE